MKKRKTMMILILVLVMLVFALIIAGAIEQKSDKNEAVHMDDKKIAVALSEIDSENPWRVAQITSFINAAADRGYEFIYDDTIDKTEEGQIKDIENILAQSVDYLAVVPYNDTVLSKTINLVKETDTQLILLETDWENIAASDYLTMICTDYFREGQICADILNEHFKEAEVRILEVVGDTESSVARKRADGFHQRLKQYSNMIIVDHIIGNFDRVTAEKSMEEFISSKHTQYDAIVAYSDEDGLGVLQALKVAGMNGELKPIVSINGVQDVLKAIIAKEYYATVESNPNIGTIVMHVIASNERGYHPAKQVMVPYNIYRSDNVMEQYDNAY